MAKELDLSEFTAPAPELDLSEFSGEPSQAQQKPKDRTWGEAASDFGRGVASGVGGLIQGGGTLYGLATGNMDNAATELGDSVQNYWESGQSQQLKDKKKARQVAIDAADGALSKAGVALLETMSDPSLAADMVASNLVTMLPGGAAGRLAAGAKYSRGLAAASEFGPVSAVAREALAKSAGSLGTKTAIGVGALQQGADVSQDVYKSSMEKPNEVWMQNPDFVNAFLETDKTTESLQRLKHEFSLEAARATLPAASAISVAANALPGGSAIERMMVGKGAKDAIKEGTKYAAVKGALKGGLGEMTSEGIEEGGGAFSGNVAKQQFVDPGQDLMDKVGENAGLGMAGGLLLGTPSGAFHGPVERNPVDQAIKNNAENPNAGIVGRASTAAHGAMGHPNAQSDDIKKQAVEIEQAFRDGGLGSKLSALGEGYLADFAAARDIAKDVSARPDLRAEALKSMNNALRRATTGKTDDVQGTGSPYSTALTVPKVESDSTQAGSAPGAEAPEMGQVSFDNRTVDAIPPGQQRIGANTTLSGTFEGSFDGNSGQPTGTDGLGASGQPTDAAASMGAESGVLDGARPNQEGLPAPDMGEAAGDAAGVNDAPISDQSQTPVSETQSLPTPPREYRYAMVNRPVDVGTTPKEGLIRAEPRPDPSDPHYAYARNGVAVFNRPLTAEETKGYEMALMADENDIDEAANRVANDLLDYADGYIRMAKAKPEQFVGQVAQRLKSISEGYPVSVGDTNAFAALVAQKLAQPVTQVAPTPKVEGEPINGTWTAFSPESGTLNIPRKEMPQIKSEHRGAMTQFLMARGVEATPEVVPASELKPTQHEFSPAKVRQAEKFEDNDRPILVSEDGHILDGHHQWLAKLNKGGPVKVTRLNAPISALLELMQDFPSAGMTKPAEPISQPTETTDGTQAQETVTPEPGQQGLQPTGQPAAAQPAGTIIPSAPQARTPVAAPASITAAQAPATIGDKKLEGPAVYRKRVAQIAHFVNKGFSQIEETPQGVALVNPKTNEFHQLTGSIKGVEATAAKNLLAKVTPQVYASQQTTGVRNDGIGAAGAGLDKAGAGNSRQSAQNGGIGLSSVPPQYGRSGTPGATSVGSVASDGRVENAALENTALVEQSIKNIESYKAHRKQRLLTATDPIEVAKLRKQLADAPKLAHPPQAELMAFAALKSTWSNALGSVPIVAYWDENSNDDGFELGGVTHINLSKPHMALQWTMGHEFKHAMGKNPSVYVQRLEDSIWKQFTETGKKKFYEEFLHKREGKLYANASADDLAHLREEMLAEFMGSRFTDKAWLKKLAKEKPYLFGEFIKEWIPMLDNMIRSLRSVIGLNQDSRKNVDKYIKDLEKAKRDAMDIAIAWAGQYQSMAKSTGADGVIKKSMKLEDDIAQQEQWLDSKAKEAGYKDTEDMFAKNAKMFMALAREWRETNPADVLRSAKNTPEDLQQELQDELNGVVSDERIKAHGLHAEDAYDDPEWVNRAGGLLRAEIPNLYTEGKTATIQLEPEANGLWGATMRGTWIGPADIEATGYATLKFAKAFIKRFVASKDLLKRGFDILTATGKKDQLADSWMAIENINGSTRYAKGKMDGYPMKVIAQKLGITNTHNVSVLTEKMDGNAIAYVLEFTDKSTGADQSAMLEVNVKNGKRIGVAHTASLTKGGLGAGVYQMFAEFAASRGIQIHPDESLSGINTYRRTEQMLSAALRTGKSNVMIPHDVQRVYGFNNNASTEQEHKDNIARLLLTGLRNARELAPGLDKLHYIPDIGTFKEKGQFLNGKGESAESTVKKMLMNGDARAFGLGRSTLARAVLTKDLLAGVDIKTDHFVEPVLYSARDGDLFNDDFADKNTVVDTDIVISSKGETMLGGNQNSDGQQITATKQGLKNFWRWFGQSEATDDDGNPLVLYHSTNADTNTLRPNQKTTNNYGLLGDVETSRAGIFATPEREFSQEYLRTGDGQNVMQIYMSLQKPFDTRKGISESMESELDGVGVSTRWLANMQNDWEMYDNDENGENLFVEKLKELGYDGAIFNEDGKDGRIHTTYMAFEPNQIKSATGNRGTFDGSDDVRYSTKPRDASTHVLSVARDERVTSDNTSISTAEEKVIQEAARKMKTSTSEVEALVRENKSNHPESDGWAELTLTGVKEKLDDNGEPTGKFDLVYKTVPYQFNTGGSGKALKPGSAEYASEVTRLSESMLREVRGVFDRAQAGDAAAKVIIAQAGWYKEMRTRLRQEFGGLGDLFADLLGATSPNTMVRTNWDNSVEALRMAAAGEYDEMIPKWLQWADGVKAMEDRFKEFVNSMLDAGMTQAAIKEMGEYKWLKEQASASRVLPDELIPRKENGKRFGFNGKNVARAMIDLWRVVKNSDALIGRGGTAPKAINFSGNLIGFRSRATIDVWAARILQRLYGGKRIASSAEGGVTGEARQDGTNTLQFGFGQDVFSKTADLIRRDVEMSENPTLRSINDDDLQALVWFIEKEVWTKNNWTSAAGEGGSFEFESDLAGILDRAKVNEIRKVMDSSVSSTPEQRARAELVIETIQREMQVALAAPLKVLKDNAQRHAMDKGLPKKDRLTPEQKAEIAEANSKAEADKKAIKASESYKNLQKVLNKQKAILKKPTTEENLATRGEAVAQLKAISSTLNRYFGGISLQQGAEQGVAPTIVTDAEMAALSQDVRDAISNSDSGATVIGVKAISTEGRYGDPERALDLEVIVRDGFNPKPMAAAVFKAAENAKQDAAFIARVLKPNEAFDPLKHRPGIEIYFQDMKQAKEAAKMMSEIVAQRTSKPLDVGPGYFEISGFTVVVDGRITPETRAGAMGTPVGMRIIYLPEFEARYGIDPRLENSTDDELSAIINERADDLAMFARDVLKKFSGVSFAGRFDYEVDVRFAGEYQRTINDYTSRKSEAANRSTNDSVWSGRSNRESIAAATGRLQVNGSQPGAKLQDRDSAVKASARDAGRPSDRSRPSDGASVRQAVHYGRLPGLTTLSGQSFGTGIKGAEQERLSTATDPRIKQRVYFYAPVQGGIPNPEVGLGGNVYQADLENIYDPLTAKKALTGKGNAFESAVLDAGYDGYTDPESGVIVMLGKDVPVKHVGGLGDFKVVQRQVQRVIPKNITRSEGDYLVRRPEGPEMLALANPAKQAKVKAAAPSFALQYGEFRVKASEAIAADKAISEFSKTFRFTTESERKAASINALQRLRKCLS